MPVVFSHCHFQKSKAVLIVCAMLPVYGFQFKIFLVVGIDSLHIIILTHMIIKRFAKWSKWTPFIVYTNEHCVKL